MKTLTRNEFEEFLEQNPGKKFAFFESIHNKKYDPVLHITHGDEKFPSFGANAIELSRITCDYDSDVEVICNYDWNLKEYSEEEKFVILENDELKELIKLLTSAIN